MQAVLCARATERLVIDRLIAAAREGQSGVLVIRGDPGIGKTALLDYAARRASASVPPGGATMQVIRCVGVESEAEVSFAGLHLLLSSMFDRCALLPLPQRSALEAALGRRSGQYDRFLVGLAVLSLLAELAGDGPLLCLVDDAHWLDRASAEALVFAARRLHAEGIAVIFAARDQMARFPAEGLPELRLVGLDTISAVTLVDAHAADLPAQIRSRVLEEAQGNPLGLIELSAIYRDNAPVNTAPDGMGLVLTTRLQRAFQGQAARLPDHAQTMLLVAAAEGSGNLAVVADAAERLGAEVADLAPAEAAGLIRTLDGTVMFRHPLIRAAVYQGAALPERLAVHRALAEALSGSGDADRRAWHLAAATSGPDEAVAAELERTAEAAGSRSGYEAAAAAYERAVQLSADPAARAGRLTKAAVAAAQIGEFNRARNLAARAATQCIEPILQARLANVRALSDFAQGRLTGAHRQLLEGASRIARQDPRRAARMLMNAMHIAWFLGDQAVIGDTAQRLRVVGASTSDSFKPLIRLMLCSAAQAAGHPSGDSSHLDELVAEARGRTADPDDLAMIGMVCLITGLNAEACDLLGEAVADARLQGRIGRLPTALACQAQALLFDGRHSNALACATEALQIARDTGQPQWAFELNGMLAYLAAVRGDDQLVHQLADDARVGTANHCALASTPWMPWALGLLDLGQGRPDAALARLETIALGATHFHASALRAVPDLIEVAVRLGQPDRALKALARFRAWADHAARPATDALVERCQALLETDRNPERHYMAALKLHDESFEQARTQLLYGAWLRRTRRKAEARTQLRAAIDSLDRAQAAPWAELARVELTATGITVPHPDRTGVPRLTPQELQVTRLAAQGLSNRDIAAQLLLSPRTVGYHLYKAYPKLAITSRGELDPRMFER